MSEAIEIISGSVVKGTLSYGKNGLKRGEKRQTRRDSIPKRGEDALKRGEEVQTRGEEALKRRELNRL